MDWMWIVYDITDLRSFQDVRLWHNIILQHRPAAREKIRLIGNKIDLYDRRVVQTQQGRDLARELGIPEFFKTSAKTYEGVLELAGMQLAPVELYKNKK
ncbi:GTP-binding protein [Tulasnella sp. JGI-2019a]|nr:GTP-binding protein [Tulasnella sp. JGI-2019a]KAG9003086.1 GTP-binding protein [Tulasnella sp. JGI-2019a]